MKKLILVLVILFFSYNAYAHKFEGIISTPTYYLIVYYGCQDGEMACKNVELLEINKKDGTSQKFKGKTRNRGKDLNFDGYIFETKYKTRILFLSPRYMYPTYKILKKIKNDLVEESDEKIKYLD